MVLDWMLEEKFGAGRVATFFQLVGPPGKSVDQPASALHLSSLREDRVWPNESSLDAIGVRLLLMTSVSLSRAWCARSEGFSFWRVGGNTDVALNT